MKNACKRYIDKKSLAPIANISSDSNGGTVQIGNADGYNPTGYVTDWGWQ